MLLRVIVIVLMSSFPASAAPLDRMEPTPAGWTGRVFAPSYAFPNKTPPAEVRPWEAIDFKTNAAGYMAAVLSYVLEGQNRSTWDVAEDLKSGRLRTVLPEYREGARLGVYAVYPCRQYVPAKLRVFVDFLAGLYTPEPYWDRGLNTTYIHAVAPAPVKKPALRATP